MAYLLDTSILIHAFERTPQVLAKMAEHEHAMMISVLCLAEVRRGIYRDPGLLTARKARLDVLLAPIPVLDFGRTAVEAYEHIIAQLGFARSRVFDRLIAAHAISVGAILVTDNQADISDVPGLALENWTVT